MEFFLGFHISDLVSNYFFYYTLCLALSSVSLCILPITCPLLILFLLLSFRLFGWRFYWVVPLLIMSQKTAEKPTFFPMLFDLSVYASLLFTCFNLCCRKFCFFSLSFLVCISPSLQKMLFIIYSAGCIWFISSISFCSSMYLRSSSTLL